MSQATRPHSGPGLANGTGADAGQQPAGPPGAGPADRVAVIADEPLDPPSHDHVVRGQGAAVPEGNRHGHAVAADVGGRLAAGGCGVDPDPAHEPHAGAEVVEVEGPADPVRPGCQPGSVRRNAVSTVVMVASLLVPCVKGIA